jgi:hypothetical protein
MKGATIFRYVFAARGGYGYASALADVYRVALGLLRRIVLVSGLVMVACVVSRWEDGVDSLSGPLFAGATVVFVLALSLLVLLIAPVASRLRRW